MRKFLVVLLLLGLGWSIPAARARTWDPVLVRLGHAGNRALEPSRNASARSGANHLLRTLLADLGQGRPIPEPRSFEEWARRRFPDPTVAIDPWGTPYFLERVSGRTAVGSAGPDRRRGTPDDILAVAPL